MYLSCGFQRPSSHNNLCCSQDAFVNSSLASCDPFNLCCALQWQHSKRFECNCPSAPNAAQEAFSTKVITQKYKRMVECPFECNCLSNPDTLGCVQRNKRAVCKSNSEYTLLAKGFWIQPLPLEMPGQYHSILNCQTEALTCIDRGQAHNNSHNILHILAHVISKPAVWPTGTRWSVHVVYLCLHGQRCQINQSINQSVSQAGSQSVSQHRCSVGLSQLQAGSYSASRKGPLILIHLCSLLTVIEV